MPTFCSFATDQRSPFHPRARQWLEAQLNGTTRVGLPWHSLLAFLRIATSPRIFSEPLTDGGFGVGPGYRLAGVRAGVGARTHPTPHRGPRLADRPVPADRQPGPRHPPGGLGHRARVDHLLRRRRFRPLRRGALAEPTRWRDCRSDWWWLSIVAVLKHACIWRR